MANKITVKAPRGAKIKIKQINTFASKKPKFASTKPKSKKV